MREALNELIEAYQSAWEHEQGHNVIENFVQSMTDKQFDDFVNAVEASPSRPKVALRPVTAR
jgi:uncharacterized protein YihD (DUF1040 family)